jgi:hypothetical protein
VDHTVEDGEELHSALLSDRRRAQRKDYQNPHLIALLRGKRAAEPGGVEAEATQEAQAPQEAQADLPSDYDQSSLRPARGVAYGLLFGAALWALIALVWYLV